MKKKKEKKQREINDDIFDALALLYAEDILISFGIYLVLNIPGKFLFPLKGAEKYFSLTSSATLLRTSVASVKKCSSDVLLTLS